MENLCACSAMSAVGLVSVRVDAHERHAPSAIVTIQLDQSWSVEPGQRAVRAHEHQDDRLFSGEPIERNGPPRSRIVQREIAEPLTHLAIHGQRGTLLLIVRQDDRARPTKSRSGGK